MANVIVDAFGTYGTGPADVDTPAGLAMLSGAWAGVDSGFADDFSIGTLPWDSSNDDLYIGHNINLDSVRLGWRRVLPAAVSTAVFSFYLATSALPSVPGTMVLSFKNASNEAMAHLMLLTTGGLALVDDDGTSVGTVLASTSGPVIVAESATHCECKIDTDAGTFELHVAGEQVIDASGLTFSNVGDVAQFNILSEGGAASSDSPFNVYMSHLIVRDTSGDANNDITGDRKVATLFVNSDDDANQGWTPRHIQRFGVGVLDITPDESWASIQTGTDTDIGSNEFTIEGQFRFQTLPGGSDKAVLFGKWGEENDERSYQLYLGGPDLDNGLFVFRASTDGANGTVVDKLTWPWKPVTGQWYHVAMVRSDGDLFLFIDGVQQGLPVADSDTYFAGDATPALGAQTEGSSGLEDTHFDGWVDEFRLTIGAARYDANFTPPTEGFPRGGNDPDWGSVRLLASFDNAVIADDGPLSLSMSSHEGAEAITPNDGSAAFQTIDEMTPDDDNFIEAALTPAEGLFTLTGLPTAAETVTVGTEDGSDPAVYEFVDSLSDPFDVLIGADVAETMDNLAAAINAGAGEGTVYGTDTTANADVSAEVMPTNQLRATALVPGDDGNDIDSTTTASNGSWEASTLEGGQDIPDYSQFSFERMPANTTVIDSVTFAARQWRNEAGSANTQLSFVGGSGGVSNGASNVLGNTPSLTFDTFEEDPDGGGITPTTILLSKVRIDRTV